MKSLIKLIVMLGMLAILAPLANATSSFLDLFNYTYPAAASTLGQNCLICHLAPEGGSPPTAYGSDYAIHGYSFSNIEQLDSDNDGFTNLQEIQALTYPGDPTSHPANTDFIGTPTSGPFPLTVKFEAAPENSPTTWAWDFGDGSTSTLQNPVHTYTISDSYTVSLTVTGTGGPVQIIKNGYINVWFCGTSPVRNEQTREYYNSIQNAYNLLPIFGGVIQIQALEFTENLTFDHQLLIALDGGYNCDFMSNPGFTTVHGTMTISGGTATIENLILR